MIHVTCRLTAKNWDQLRNPSIGNRVRATFTFFKYSSDYVFSSVSRFVVSEPKELLSLPCHMPGWQFANDHLRLLLVIQGLYIVTMLRGLCVSVCLSVGHKCEA